MKHRRLFWTDRKLCSFMDNAFIIIFYANWLWSMEIGNITYIQYYNYKWLICNDTRDSILRIIIIVQQSHCFVVFCEKVRKEFKWMKESVRKKKSFWTQTSWALTTGPVDASQRETELQQSCCRAAWQIVQLKHMLTPLVKLLAYQVFLDGIPWLRHKVVVEEKML